jgi:hypothetical protein
MIPIFIMLALLVASIGPSSSNPPKVPVRLVLSGPRSAHAGEPLPLHLKLKNVSTDQQVRFVEGCLNHYVSWKIHANNGKGTRPSGIEIDCSGSEHVLEPGQEKQWAVDPSLDVAFSSPGNYFITAIYTFDQAGSLGTLETPTIVESNTIIVSVR